MDKLQESGLHEKPKLWGDSDGDPEIPEHMESGGASVKSRTFKDVAKVHEWLNGPVIVQKGSRDFTFSAASGMYGSR